MCSSVLGEQLARSRLIQRSKVDLAMRLRIFTNILKDEKTHLRSLRSDNFLLSPVYGFVFGISGSDVPRERQHCAEVSN